MRLTRLRLRSGCRARGFTLIELLAVVLILGLLAALVAPNVGFGSSRALRGESQQLADALEFARQRAVMTGRIHRFVLDLEAESYWVEWVPPTDRSDAGGAAGAASPSNTRLLSLSPPRSANAQFIPVPYGFGREQALAESVGVVGVELQKRRIRRGSVAIAFQTDGTADPAVIWLADLDGEESQALEVRPLADAVVVRDVEG